MSVWYEIIVTGSEGALRAFVAGCEAALGRKETVIFGHDLDLEASRLSQRLLELFAAGSHHSVFAPSELAEAGVAASVRRSRGLDILAACGQLHLKKGVAAPVPVQP